MSTPLSDQELLDLETLIDRRGIENVLWSMSAVCARKSEHITHNWQDRPLAKRWAAVGVSVGHVASKGAGL